jgi:hypothetical protein
MWFHDSRAMPPIPISTAETTAETAAGDEPGPAIVMAEAVGSERTGGAVAAEVLPDENARLSLEAEVLPLRWKPQSWPVRLWHGVWWFGEQAFGWLSLMIGLAVLATVPLAQFVSLGYLLECSGRIARSGRLRDGLSLDLDRWSRVGGLVAGTWLALLPLRLVADFANSAHIIAPGSHADRAWRVGLLLFTALTVGHILLAWYSGGKLRHFLWPLLAPFSLGHWVITRKVMGPIVRPLFEAVSPRLADDLYQPSPLTSWFPPAILFAGLTRGPATMYAEARDAVWEFVVGLRLPHYFWLGLRGFIGAIAWLFVPVLLLIGSTKISEGSGAFLVGFSGALALATVLLYLPFLQAHFAAENRFAALFELGTVRQLFRRAPIAFWFALLMTLALALPPYLFKIQQVYDEFHWLMSLLFVFLVYPGRLLSGWAVGMARRRERPAFILFRWLSRLVAVPLCLTYVLFVYLSQYTSWFGSWSLFEQHPFLVPVPFLGG